MDKRRHESNDHRSPKTGNPAKNSIFKGDVVSLQSYGAFVSIPGSRKQGLLHVSQLSQSRVENPSEVVSIGDRVYCKVISIEEDGDKIGLSMKVVNQTSGEDMDPNLIQTKRDEQRRKKDFQRDIPKITLDAVFDTTCKKCGSRGHLAQDCFHIPGKQTYTLLTEEPTGVPVADDAKPPRKHKSKKEKKHKKSKKKKDSHKHKKKSKKHKHRKSYSSSSDDEKDSEENLPKQYRQHEHNSSDSDDYKKRDSQRGSTNSLAERLLLISQSSLEDLKDHKPEVKTVSKSKNSERSQTKHFSRGIRARSSDSSDSDNFHSHKKTGRHVGEQHESHKREKRSHMHRDHSPGAYKAKRTKTH